MGNVSQRERFEAVVTDLLDADPRVALVLADIGVSRFQQTGAVTRHRDRIINVGIREQLMISVAGGLALGGLRPFVHSYTPFLIERPFEQIKLDLVHQGVGAVLVSIGASYDAASEGRTHQSPGDVALLGTLPGFEVHVPGHPDEAEVLLRHSAIGTGPAYIRLAEDSNREAMPVTPGRFHLVRDGSHATVISVGTTLDAVLDATEGLDVTVLYAATVRPFDHAALRAVGSHTVVLVEPYLAGTSSGEVSQALIDLPHRLLTIGVPNTEHRRYGAPGEHERAHGLDGAGIRTRIAEFLGE